MSGYSLAYIDQNGFEYAITDGIHVFLQPGGLHGFGALRLDAAAARRPYRDGAMPLGRPYTPAREMQVAVALYDVSYAAWVERSRNLARAMSAYKDPDALGTLKVITPDGLERRIDCWLVEWPDPEMTGPTLGVVTATFWAATPWFYDPVPVEEIIALSGAGGITFPVTFPITFEATSINTRVDLENAGDVETWPTVRVNGPGANIVIENETMSKTLALTAGAGLTLDASDYVLVDMAEATVRWWDASAGEFKNATAYLSAASEFWPLRRGANTIHAQMANATSGSMVFTFRRYYQCL
jgi:hypothetical protein